MAFTRQLLIEEAIFTTLPQNQQVARYGSFMASSARCDARERMLLHELIFLFLLIELFAGFSCIYSHRTAVSTIQDAFGSICLHFFLSAVLPACIYLFIYLSIYRLPLHLTVYQHVIFKKSPSECYRKLIS